MEIVLGFFLFLFCVGPLWKCLDDFSSKRDLAFKNATRQAPGMSWRKGRLQPQHLSKCKSHATRWKGLALHPSH